MYVCMYVYMDIVYANDCKPEKRFELLNTNTYVRNYLTKTN